MAYVPPLYSSLPPFPLPYAPKSRDIIDHKLIWGFVPVIGVTPALRAKFARLHARAAAPGRRSARRTWRAVVSSATLPAWCAAARGTGTRYSRVEIPSMTCTLAIANNAVVRGSASGGSAARMAARRLDAKSSAVARYVVVASTRWSNCTVVGFSKKLRQRPVLLPSPSLLSLIDAGAA